MPAPAASDLLDTWEAVSDSPPSQRDIELLARASDAEASELVLLAHGRVQILLVELRAHLFGPQLTAVLDCPGCGSQLEFPLDTGDLHDGTVATDALSLTSGGYEIECRIPTAGDLAAVAELASVGAARTALLERSCTATDSQGRRVAACDLPPSVVAEVEAHMEKCDPAGSLDLHCVACGHDWRQQFDIGAFLWSELDAWARSSLREIHKLARAYGWRERDILALGARRRRHYLELAST
jgi:hypothetical protein